MPFPHTCGKSNGRSLNWNWVFIWVSNVVVFFYSSLCYGMTQRSRQLACGFYGHLLALIIFYFLVWNTALFSLRWNRFGEKISSVTRFAACYWWLKFGHVHNSLDCLRILEKIKFTFKHYGIYQTFKSKIVKREKMHSVSLFRNKQISGWTTLRSHA
jgi:hypothetical protein